MDGAALAGCRAALAEAAALEPDTRADWRAWEAAASLLWRELHEDAGVSGPVEYLAEEFDGNPAAYVDFVVGWCEGQIDKAGRSDAIQAAAVAVRDERAVLSGGAAQTMERYSETLDREPAPVAPRGALVVV